MGHNVSTSQIGTVPSQNRHFSRQLIIFFLLFSLTPLLLLAAKNYWKNTQDITRHMGDMLTTQARNTMDKIDRNLFERYGDVQAFAANPAAIGGSADSLTEVANTYSRLYGIYDLMLIADVKSHAIIATNTKSSEGKAIEVTNLIGTSVADESWFQACILPTFKRDTTFVMDVFQDPRVEKRVHTDGQVLGFAAPIYGPDGTVIRVWLNLASRERIIGEIMTEVRANATTQGLANVEVQAVDRHGVLIDDYDPAARLKVNLSDKINAVKKALAGEIGFTMEPHARRPGHPVYINGYAGSKGAMGFSGLGMGVMIRVPQADIEQETRWILLVDCAVIIGFGIVLTLLSLFVARGISRPVQQLDRALAQLAKGDLRPCVESQRRDEIGRMCTSFNQALSSIGGVIGRIGTHSTTIAQSATSLQSTSLSMSTSAEQAAQQSATVAASAEEISRSASTVATGMEEMSASIQEIAKSAQNGARIADEALQVAQQTNAQMDQLGQASNEIGEIIKVIASIAEQTNLLALNATIEAARAGESGRGFTVVAQEVKILAQQTAKSSVDIAAKVQSVQHGVKSGVAGIARIAEIVSRITMAASTIASAVEEQSATTNEISGNISEMSRGAQDIAANVVSLSEVARNTTSSAGSTTAAAQELSRLSAELQALMARFQV